jgi:hypothetical protein
MIDAESVRPADLSEGPAGMSNRVRWILAGAGVVIAAVVVAVVLVILLRGDSGPVVAAAQITVEEITNRV